MEDSILELDDVSKYFRSHWTFRPIRAVQNVTLSIRRGESFGYLGHNGAGKTTTIKCILGLIHKSSGRILFNGNELGPAEQNRYLGYLPEQPYFYDHLSVNETLDFFSSLHGLKRNERKRRVNETLELLGIADRCKASVRSLSKGLQQRLGFAQAIINKPELLILDEPFSGLDPLGRMDIRRLILDLNRQGTTIFMSSHILADVEDICDRVSIMNRGELKTVFSLSESGQLFGGYYELRLTGENVAQIEDQLRQLATESDIEDTLGGVSHIYRFQDYNQAQEALTLATTHSCRVDQFVNKYHSLEEIFVNITNSSQPNTKIMVPDLKGNKH